MDPEIPGLAVPGNLDLSRRPVVHNADGSVSTVYTSSNGQDGYEVLVPGVSMDGRKLEPDQAWAEYLRTGQHFGKFKDIASADAYAARLHGEHWTYHRAPDGQEYATFVGGPGSNEPPRPTQAPATPGIGMDPELTQLIQQAHAAIANGKDPQGVAAKFRELSGGQDLPSPAEFLGQNAPPPQESDPSILAKPTAMMTGRERMDLRTQQLAGQTGDNPSYTPDKVKAIGPTAAALAVGTAIPGSTLLGREAGYGLSGAVQGGLSAEPGHRTEGAVKGGLFGLGVGNAGELAGGLWGTLTKPARIQQAIDQVDALRAPYGAALYDPLNQPVTDAAVLKFLKDPAIKNDVAAVAQDVADGSRAPMLSDLQKLRTRWAAGRFKDAQAREQLSNMMQRIEPAIKEKDALYAQFNDTGRQLAKNLKPAEDAAKRLAKGLLVAGGVGYAKHLLAP